MDAIDAVRAVANVADVNLVGVCAGGITTAATLGHLAAIDDSRVHSVTFMVTMLDLDYDTDATLFLSKWSTELAVRNSQRSGVFSGGELSRLFAFLRPNDMVWGFWVNNYLLGHEPPAFDLLAWSADMPNLSAGLHRDFATLALHNPLPRSGALTVRGTPIDLGAVTQDAYVVMALTDHITPWQGCYRTAGLLGGRSRVVLSSSGHMTAVVNPPTTTPSRDSYWVGEDTPTDPHRFQELAEHRTGSWWTDWTNWLVERGGTRKAAPAGLGSDRFPALDAAPGQYVVS
jgi:polyhydroxyalkanoate synthase